jgi:hypothetical protein
MTSKNGKRIFWMPCVARIEPQKKFKPPCRGQREFVEEQGRAAFCPTQHRKLSRVESINP